MINEKQMMKLMSELLVVNKVQCEQNVEILHHLQEVMKALEPKGEKSVLTVVEELFSPMAKDISKIYDKIEIEVDSNKLFNNENNKIDEDEEVEDKKTYFNDEDENEESIFKKDGNGEYIF